MNDDSYLKTHDSSSSSSDSDDDEFMQRFDPKKLFLGIQRHLLLIIVSMLFWGLLGAAATYHYLKIFKADAIVLFQEDMPKTLSGGYILTNFSLPTVLDMIKLSSNFQAVKAILGLDLSAKEIEKMTDISTPRNNSNLIKITAVSDNPNLVVDVANTLAKIAVKNGQEFYQRQLQTALENFKTELDNMRKRLTSQTNEIEEFKKTHQYFEMNAEYTGLLNQLEEIRGKFSNATLRYNSLLVEYENLKRESQSIPEEKPISFDSRNNPLQTRILGLQTALAEARSRYAKENPKVKTLERELDDLLQQLNGADSEGAKDQKQLMEPNPSKEKINIELMRMLGKVRAAQKIKQDVLQNLQKLESESANLPSKQIAFAKLLQNKEITEEQIKFLNNAVESTQLLLNVPKGSLELYQQADRALPFKESILYKMLPILGLIFGGLLGIGLSFLIEIKDPYIRTGKQAELDFNIPCFQVIPEIPNLLKKQPEEHIHFFIRHLAERLELASRGRKTMGKEGLAITFLSSQEGEGKSLISTYLAKYFYNINKKVIFLEFDYRPNPFLDEPPPHFPSADTYFRGAADINDIIIPGKPDLIYIRQAEFKMKEFLRTPAMSELWKKLKSEYDLIIIDTPGIIEDHYAPNLAAMSDITVFVIGSSIVRKHIINESIRELEILHLKPSGIVLNRVHPDYLDDRRIALESKRAHKSFWRRLAFWK